MEVVRRVAVSKDSLLFVSQILRTAPLYLVRQIAVQIFFFHILCSLGIHKLVIILYLQCGFNALSFRFVDTVDWSLLQVLFINIH